MAEKDYNVSLNVEVGQSISNIEDLINKMKVLAGAANDLSKDEIALNVVVRNQGFNSAIDNLNKSLGVSRKRAQEVGTGLTSGMTKASTELKNKTQEITKMVAGIGKTIEQTFNKVSKDISEKIAKGVRSGLSTGLKWSRFNVGMKTYQSFTDLRKMVKEVQTLQNSLGGVAENIKQSVQSIQEAATNVSKRLGSVNGTVVRQVSGLEWRKANLTAYEQAQIDIKKQQDARAAEIAYRKETQENERAERQLDIEQRRKDTLADREQKRQDKLAKAQERRENSIIHNQDIQAKRQELKYTQEIANAEGNRRAIARARQTVEEVSNEVNSQGLRERTELQKKMLEFKNAEARVNDQIASLDRGRVVSEQAIRKAQEQRREKELAVYQEVVKQLHGYDEIKRLTNEIAGGVEKISTIFQRMSSIVGSVNSMIANIRGVANRMANSILRIGRMGLQYATQAARTMVSTATEQYQKLETAQIGFENFFGAEEATRLIPRIQREAINAPGLNAGDLADYVRQLAPVSNHNADLALNAALGMLKTIQYGGAEGSTEMEYVIKNVRDVMAKGEATRIDLRQFNRAMPILTEVLGSIGRSDLIQDGELNITPENARTIMAAFADLNADPNSPVADIYDKIGNTLEGLQEAIKEQFTSGLNTTLTDLGVYERVKSLLKEIKDGGVLDEMFTWIAETAKKIIDTLSGLDWKNITAGLKGGASTIWESIKKVFHQLMETLGETDAGGLIERVATLVGKFIEGFGNGVNKMLGILDTFQKRFGADSIEKVAEFFGTMASPFGSLIQNFGKFLEQILYIVSRFFGLTSTSLRLLGTFRMKNIEGMASNSGLLSRNQTFLKAVSKEMANPDSIALYQSMLGNSAVFRNSAADTMSVYNKATGQLDTASNFSKMSLAKQFKFLGFGNTVKVAFSEAIRGLANGLGKALQVGAITASIQSAATIGEEIAQASGNSNMADVINGLGNVLSMTIGLGSAFGAAGAKIGLFLGAVQTVIDQLNQIDARRQEEIENAIAEGDDKRLEVFAENVKQNLRQMGLFDYSQNAEDALEEMKKSYAEMAESATSEEDLMRKMMEKYTQIFLSYTMRDRVNAFGERWEEEHPGGQGENTGLGDKNAAGIADALRNIYNRLVEMGLIVGEGEGWADTATGEEIWKVLDKNGISIDSQEALGAFNAEITQMAIDFNQRMSEEKQATLKFYFADGSGRYSNMEEFMRANNFTLGSDGKWHTQAEMEIIQKYGQENFNDPDMWSSQIKWNNMRDLWDKGDYWGSWWSYVGSLGDWVRESFGGKHSLFANGGRVRPIFKADGGEISGRGVDTVPAMLQPGEFVMRRSAASRIGDGILNALNFGDLARAANMLGAKFSSSVNNARSFVSNTYSGRRTVNNHIVINNRNRSGTISSYYGLANRLAVGF